MYTKRYNDVSGLWDILTPDSDVIAECPEETDAEILLSHLNRE